MKRGNGALDICVKKDPAAKWDDENGDHYTGMQIGFEEWEDLFYGVLKVPQPERYIEGELFIRFDERQKRLFKEDVAKKGYEMLARIWDIYQDAEFAPAELKRLLDECLKLEKITESLPAHSALEMLIIGCREALKSEAGLVLVSD